jgi:hypothetical protein
MKRTQETFDEYDKTLDVYDEYGYWDRLRRRQSKNIHVNVVIPRVTPIYAFCVINSLPIVLDLMTLIKSLYMYSNDTLYIKSPSSSYQTLSINIAKCRVIDVKEAIYRIRRIPVDQQRLVCMGKALTDDNGLSDYKIVNGSVIYFLTAFRGD